MNITANYSENIVSNALAPKHLRNNTVPPTYSLAGVAVACLVLPSGVLARPPSILPGLAASWCQESGGNICRPLSNKELTQLLLERENVNAEWSYSNAAVRFLAFNCTYLWGSEGRELSYCRSYCVVLMEPRHIP